MYPIRKLAPALQRYTPFQVQILNLDLKSEAIFRGLPLTHNRLFNIFALAKSKFLSDAP